MDDITIKRNDLVRIVILDISNILASNVYDEVLIPVNQATDFIKKYIDMKKYRIVTV